MDVLNAPSDDGLLLRLDALDHFHQSLDHSDLVDILDSPHAYPPLQSPAEKADLHDSGSDCMAMDSPEDEPYIDVVSEDSAIQEENLDDFSIDDAAYSQLSPSIDDAAYSQLSPSIDDAAYSQLSPMDSLMPSHNTESAIMKTEIFDPAFDRLLACSDADYEHDFLTGMDITSNLLTSAHRSYSDSALNQSLTEKCPESMSTNLLNDASSSKSETDVQHVNTSAPVTSSQSPSINSLGNSQQQLLPQQQQLQHSTTAASGSATGVNSSAVLTTPFYIAQDAAGASGQPNSIITTHMARLVPSPDGKGYILHLGLNPNTSPAASSGAMTSPAAAAAAVNSQALLSATGSTCSSLSPQMTAANTLAVNPASLNITITPAKPTVGITDSTVGSQQQHMAAPLTSPVNSASMDTSDKPGHVTPMTAATAQVFAKLISGDNLMHVNDSSAAVLTNVAGNATTQLQAQPATVTLSPAATLIAHPAAAAATLTASPNLLTELTREQLLHQMQVLQRQQQQAQLGAAGGGSGVKGKSTKRRNSKEVRDLLDVEKMTVFKNGELDRFVICSDGPMNCALCGYNTDNYSSFKSHIICSHPCWRITKKLSRNRLLVEKSVKVSIPVANFSVPNPVPAVPIQQPRVQSRKSKKAESQGSTIKHDTDEPSATTTTSKESRQSGLTKTSLSSSLKEKSGVRHSLRRSWSLVDDFDFDVVNTDADDDDSDEMLSSHSSMSLGRSSGGSKLSSSRQRTLASERLSALRQFRCGVCQKLFTCESTALTHIGDAHHVTQPLHDLEMSSDHGQTFGPLLSCAFSGCSFRASSQAALESHKADMHTAQAVYRCQICGYFADSTQAVKEHVDKIHPQQDMMFGLSD